jgi:hypothetical protein
MPAHKDLGWYITIFNYPTGECDLSDDMHDAIQFAEQHLFRDFKVFSNGLLVPTNYDHGKRRINAGLDVGLCVDALLGHQPMDIKVMFRELSKVESLQFDPKIKKLSLSAPTLIHLEDCLNTYFNALYGPQVS